MGGVHFLTATINNPSLIWLLSTFAGSTWKLCQKFIQI